MPAVKVPSPFASVCWKYCYWEAIEDRKLVFFWLWCHYIDQTTPLGHIVAHIRTSYQIFVILTDVISGMVWQCLQEGGIPPQMGPVCIVTLHDIASGWVLWCIWCSQYGWYVKGLSYFVKLHYNATSIEKPLHFRVVWHTSSWQLVHTLLNENHYQYICIPFSDNASSPFLVQGSTWYMVTHAGANLSIVTYTVN